MKLLNISECKVFYYISISILMFFANISCATTTVSRISPPLAQKIKTAKPLEKLPILINLKSVSSSPKKSNPTSTQAELILELQKEAKESQREILEFLKEMKEEGKVGKIQAFWITNGIAVEATPDVILALGNREDVVQIFLDQPISAQEKKSP